MSLRGLAAFGFFTSQARLAVHAAPPRLLVIVTDGTQFIGTGPTVEGRQPTVTGSAVLHDHMVLSHDFDLSKAYDNEVRRAMGMTWNDAQYNRGCRTPLR